MNNTLLSRITAVLCGAMIVFSGCGGKNPEASLPESGDHVENAIPTAAPLPEKAVYEDADIGVSYAFRTEGKYISIYNGSEFVPTYLNGVNIGSGIPGRFPGELAIDEPTYYRWFEEIRDMNCNTIRVYTTMKPDFYNALYRFNRTSDQKLYLIMGVWYDEETVLETGDAYQILEGAEKEAKEQIDIIHGDCVIEQRRGRAYGTYDKDVSEYVLGWILGIESDAVFVSTTNELHGEITSYEGEYLEVDNTDAFHAFLCEFGDETIRYETEKYGMQRPLSWANWPTADELTHPDEPLQDREDAVSINIEKIHAKDSFACGLFASYHVYPYYPDFMMLEDTYVNYRDADGEINTYEAYLKDLLSLHDIPVMVAEFGVPASRGCTHVNKFSNYNQGHLTEEEQGAALADMAEDIFETGYCGGLVFTWQDEWFKRTWNTMDYTDPDRRAYWSDIQTSEQNFGLLAFDPGVVHTKILLDGKTDDWEGKDPLTEADGVKLFAESDEKYLYLCIMGDSLKPGEERVVIPLDITPKSGSDSYKDYHFDRKADFVIDLNGPEDSTVLVHAYYDRYAAVFGPYDDLYDHQGYDNINSTKFVPIYLCLNRTQTIPSTGEVKHAEHMDTGALLYGNGDPDSKDYNSLSDFIFGKNAIEIRIPWELLSFRDPSTKEVEDDFYMNGQLSGLNIEGIYLGLNTGSSAGNAAFYTWENWDEPSWHERLKKSYYILGGKFEELVL